MPTDDDTFLDELEEETPTQGRSTKKTDAEIEEAYQNISFRVVYQANNFFLPQIRSLINGREVLNLRPINAGYDGHRRKNLNLLNRYF